MSRKLSLLIVTGLVLSAGALAPAAGAAPPEPSNCAIVPDDPHGRERRDAQHLVRPDHGLQHVEEARPVQGRRRADPARHDAVHPGRQLRRHHRRAHHGGRVRVHAPGPRRDRDEGLRVLLDHDQPAAAARDHEPERHAVPGDGRGVLLLREPVRRRRGPGLHLVARLGRVATGARAEREPGADHGHADDGRHVQLHRPRDRRSREATAERTFSITIS